MGCNGSPAARGRRDPRRLSISSSTSCTRTRRGRRAPGVAAAAVKPLAAPIAGGLRELSVRAADPSRPPGRAGALGEANRRAHEAFIRIVDDEGEFLQTGEGEVVLDLQPLVQQLADRVGLTEEQVEERLGPEAGRIVIMESDQLGTVQTAVELIRKLSIWLAIAILVLFAVAVYLARGGDGKRFVTLASRSSSSEDCCSSFVASQGTGSSTRLRAASRYGSRRRTRGSSAPTCWPASPGPRSPTA